jgi:hypothetical protein
MIFEIFIIHCYYMYIACNYSRKVTLNNNSGRYVTNMQIVIYILQIWLSTHLLIKQDI